MHLAKHTADVLRYFSRRDRETLQAIPEVSRAMLEDSPKAIRITLWAIFFFFLFFIFWAAFASIDEVTRGDGQAIPSSRLQKNQNLEGGIVTEVYVHEGQIVNQGDPLLRLDDTRFASNVGETEADRLGLLSRIERLTAEINDRKLDFSPEIKEKSMVTPVFATLIFD